MAWNYNMETGFIQRNEERRRQRLQRERDSYQRQIQSENIRNLQLQNAALDSSIQAMGGRAPGQSAGISTGGSARTVGGRSVVGNYSQAFEQLRQTPGVSIGGTAQSGGSTNFPSLAEIQSMITSSQQEAEENFMSRVNLLQTQEQQRQEEEQLSARNAANRVQSYQRQSAIGAWESALRGR